MNATNITKNQYKCRIIYFGKTAPRGFEICSIRNAQLTLNGQGWGERTLNAPSPVFSILGSRYDPAGPDPSGLQKYLKGSCGLNF